MTLIAHVPNVLVVTPEFSQKTGVKTVQNLVEYAKKNPGKLNYASGGNGSAGHMAGEWLKQIKDIGHGPRPVRGCRRRAALRARGSDRPDLRQPRERHRQHPRGQAPAARRHDECARKGAARRPDDAGGGVPDFDISTWYGLFVPASTPDDVVAHLNKAITGASGPRPFRKGLKSSAASPLRQRPKSSRSS